MSDTSTAVGIPLLSHPGMLPQSSVAGVLGNTDLVASHLSPLTRKGVLPPHHPAREAKDATSYPYAWWSAGVAADRVPRPPQVVDLRGDDLRVSIDLRRGGRVVGLYDRSGAVLEPWVRTVVDGQDERLAGLRGGLELNVSPLQRSPWALEPVHAAVGLPSRLGGDRLRWWQLERISGRLVQVDLHLPVLTGSLLIIVRQVPFIETGRPANPVTLLIDDTTLSVRGHRTSRLDAQGHQFVQPAPRPGAVAWFQVSLRPGNRELTSSELQKAVAALDDPVSTSQIISDGPAWASVERERMLADGDSLPAVHWLPEHRGLEHGGQSHRHRKRPESQWLHLLHDEGLGTVDRVHPKDLGQPAGRHWARQLRRSFKREALGDWRVHLRLGDLALLDGDLEGAEARWLWSHSLRPTAWADRNIALVDTARGQRDRAAVRYLRAHRVQPDEIELAVEAVGALIAAGRVGDTRLVLDRMIRLGQVGTARYWMLEAEVALASGRAADEVERALAAASSCADYQVHGIWAREIMGGRGPA